MLDRPAVERSGELNCVFPHMASDGIEPCDSAMDTGGAVQILLVEDEFLVAALLEEDLVAAGYAVLGPYRSLASALHGARKEQFDVALLDVNLDGEMVYPLADELLSRGLPFIFVSGYSLENMPDRFRSMPRVSKPYDPRSLLWKIRQIVGR